jgi:hypothetical protein
MNIQKKPVAHFEGEAAHGAMESLRLDLWSFIFAGMEATESRNKSVSSAVETMPHTAHRSSRHRSCFE